MEPNAELRAKLMERRQHIRGDSPADAPTWVQAEHDALKAAQDELMQRELLYLASCQGQKSKEPIDEEAYEEEEEENNMIDDYVKDSSEPQPSFFEGVVDKPSVDALKFPSPDMMDEVYAAPLDFSASMNLVVRKAASTQSSAAGTLQRGDRVSGYPQGGWLLLQRPSSLVHHWLLADGSRVGLQRLLLHKYLELRILRTFPKAMLVDWDRLPAARFVDYSLQWAAKREPENVRVALEHVPKCSARIEGLPSGERVMVRVCACIYTQTKTNKGERFATLLGDWQEASTVDEPTVEALEEPRPDKMLCVYASPLEYNVQSPDVKLHQAASTRSASIDTLRRGQKVSGYQQGDWLMLQQPAKGWLLIDTSGLRNALRLTHEYLQPRVMQAFSTAVRLAWKPLPGPRFVDYGLQWARSRGEVVDTPTTSDTRIARCEGICHELPPGEEVLIRVCAYIYTEFEGNGGKLFATVVGDWVEAETEAAIEDFEEEQLCMDPMSNLRGGCMDCRCGGFVCRKSGEVVQPGSSVESGQCSRCGCACARHAILGEYHYRHVAGATPLAFRLPNRLLREAEDAEEDSAPKSLTDDATAAPNALMEKAADSMQSGSASWRPEDSSADEDRVEFVLDRIAQASTLYETLGITSAADGKEIRHAHRRIALYIHPDKLMNRNEPDLVRQAEAAFKIVSAAYEVLSDDTQRLAYDATLRSQPLAPAKRARSSRRDLVAAKLLQQFLSKAMWGWDLSSKPKGNWQELGKGVYGSKPTGIHISLVHIITKEELSVSLERETSLIMLKKRIIALVQRGSLSTIEIATIEGEMLGDNHTVSTSQTLILAGISKFGPAKDVKLCLSHAQTGARLYVEVPDTSTLARIGEVIAESLKVDASSVRLGIRWNNEEQFLDLPSTELLNGREQLLVLGVEVPINLSVEEATELQSELIEAYGAPWFQARLDQLIAQFPPLEGLLDAAFKKQWDDLLRKAQKDVLLKHGFDGAEGAYTMIRAFQRVNRNPEVQRLGALIDQKLRVTVGTALPPVIMVAAEPALPEEGGPERGLRLAVLASASIRDLRDAIASRLGEQVSRVSVGAVQQFGAFVACKDEEVLGHRRAFQVLGVELPEAEAAARPQEEQQHRALEAARPSRRPRRAAQEAPALRTCGECAEQAEESVDGTGDGGVWYCNACWAAWHAKDGNALAAGRARAANGEANVVLVQQPPQATVQRERRHTLAVERRRQVPADPEPAPAPPGKVRLAARHRRRAGPLAVDVEAGASWLDARRALARLLGAPEVLRAGRLARRAEDGGYDVLADSEAVNGDDEVLLLNVDLPDPSEVQPAALEQEGGPSRSARGAEREIEIVPRPFGPTLRLVVFSDSTGLEVMEGIAYATGRDEAEVLQGALLKPSKAGGFACVAADEVIGSLRCLHTRNVDTTPASATRASGCIKPRGQQQALPAPCVLAERAEAQRGRYSEAPWPEAPQEPELVVVRISHAMNKAEVVEVVVLDESTLSSVLEALASKVKLPNVLEKGRFVESKGGASFKGLKLQQPLGKCRELLYMGTALHL